MSKRDKLIQKILKGETEITPADAKNSHITYRKANVPSVTIVLTQNPLKPYMVQKLQAALKNEGY